MALGGGTFISQNKKLPGSYINFASAQNASSSIGERGIAAMAIEMDWGKDGEIIEVTSQNFAKDSLKIFGYDYSNEKLKGLRDLFKNVKKAYFYRLNSGNKATTDIATAKCSGTRGNDIRIVVAKNIDDDTKYDVTTYLGTKEVDKQTVKEVSELVDNDYVTFSMETLEVTAGKSLEGKSSPITNCKRERGYSKAWLHHKGKNKHHHEYWYDYETTDEVPVIPYKYTVEMICDQLAAGITYNGKNWRKDTQLKYWRNVENRRKINPRIANMLDEVYVQVSKQGIDKVINKKNLKELYKKYCE